jgi:small GTP-binding protein
MNAPTPADDHFEAARAALQTALDQHAGLSAEERAALGGGLADLEAMSAKLAAGRVDVVIFGRISTGKSALINALLGRKVAVVDVQGGSTREAGDWVWDRFGYKVPGFADSCVRLLDTPGTNEVGGAERARLARQVAARADLILFICDGDLTDDDLGELRGLVALHRPVLLVFNKTDLYTNEQRQRLRETLAKRTAGLFQPDHIVETAADPREREYVIVGADGEETTEWRKPAPRVNAVLAKALDVLDREGKAIVALNAALFAADHTDAVAAVKVRVREAHAQKIIWGAAVTKGVTVACNPIPWADLVAAGAIDVGMVMGLAQIYGIPLTRQNAVELLATIGAAVGAVWGVEWAVHTAAGFFKLATAGAGTLLTAIPQGATAATSSYFVGQVAKRYFEQGASWGPGGAKQVAADILAHADREGVLARFKDELLEKLKANRHARK